MEIIIIAAMANNRVIGKDNVLPWSIKKDMQHFKELTKGWPCIMGRKTWESLPKKPLPGRLNVVISGSREQVAGSSEQDVEVYKSLNDAIKQCADYEKIFIIGGESIYKQAMDIANKIELTLIHQDYDGDTYFPEIDDNYWKVSNKIDFDTFSFITYNKININSC